MYKLILLCLFIPSSLNAQISEEWRRFYNGPGSVVDDEGIKVVSDNAGNSFVACRTGSNVHMTLIKYDVNGNQIWLKNYEDSDSQYELVNDMKIDNEGNIIMLGYVVRDSTSDIIILKIEPSSGDEIWRANTNSPSTSESPSGMCIDNLGNICIIGTVFDLIDYDLITLKYSPSGSLIFNRRFNGSLFTKDYGRSITTDNSQNVYVVGSANEFTFSSSEYILIKYGPAGNTLWGRYYDSGNITADVARSVLVDNSDNVIVSGTTDSYENPEVTTLKYSSGGNLLWEKHYTKSSTSFDYFDRMKIDDFGNVYICAMSSADTITLQNLVKYNSNGIQQFSVEAPADIYSPGFFDFDNQKNIYLIRARDTVGNYPDSINYLNIAKFDSSGNLISDSLFKNHKPFYTLNDAFVNGEGHLFLTGSTIFKDEYAGKDLLTLKFDLSGNIYWQQIFMGEGIGSDAATSVILKNGNIYVFGSGSFGYYRSFVILKYRNDGELVWKQNFNRYPGVDDFAQASAVDNNGNVIITGYTVLAGNNLDIVTVKYDSNGILKWYRDYGDSTAGQSKSKSITTDLNGNIYITGTVTNTPGGLDWVTIKYDSEGNQIWVSQYNGGASGIDNANDIALDSENNVYVCGSANESSSGNDALIIKYNSSGSLVWIKQFSGNGIFNDEFRKIKIDDQENVYVSGTVYSEVNNDDYLIIKYDKNGNQLWQKTYNGTGSNVDRVNAMTLSNDKIIVTGESFGTGSQLDFITIEYDSSGNQSWIAGYNGALNRIDRATAITSDVKGNVYVTGESTITIGNVDFITIKYDTQGNQKQVLQYFGQANNNDRPADIAVNEKEEIYVSGTTFRQSTNTDIVTLKYSNSIGINDPVTLVPDQFKLYNNFPNPFNPKTIIQFDIPADTKVLLKIYDITGREIRTLINEVRKAGHYYESFDAKNLTSGAYFYRLIAGEFVKSKMMVLIK